MSDPTWLALDYGVEFPKLPVLRKGDVVRIEGKPYRVTKTPDENSVPETYTLAPIACDLKTYGRTRTKPPRGGGDGVGATADPPPLGSISGADGGRVILPTGPTPPGGTPQPRR